MHLNCLGYDPKLLLKDHLDEKEIPFRSMDVQFDYTDKNGNVHVKTTKILVYKCEKCKEKVKHLSNKPECMVCHKTEGFMKKVLGLGPDSRKMFVHQICALSHPEHFQVDDLYQMSFRLINELMFDEEVALQNTSLNPKKPKTCSISMCRKTGGLRRECHTNLRTVRGISGDKKNKMTKQACDVSAHAFCAFTQHNELWWKNCEDIKSKGSYIPMKAGWSF